jgi:hypothetical protein
MVLGLDMRFWAENAKNKCKSNKRLQIPFGITIRKATATAPAILFQKQRSFAQKSFVGIDREVTI